MTDCEKIEEALLFISDRIQNNHFSTSDENAAHRERSCWLGLIDALQRGCGGPDPVSVPRVLVQRSDGTYFLLNWKYNLIGPRNQFELSDLLTFAYDIEKQVVGWKPPPCREMPDWARPVRDVEFLTTWINEIE